DQRDVVLVENPGGGDVDRQIQRGLAADGRQQSVGTLALDDCCENFRRQRLDISAVGQFRVGHDGGRIAVHQYDFEPLGAQRFARLAARVVELAGLSDDNRTAADDQDFLQVGSPWHLSAFDQVKEVVKEVVGVVRTG